MTRPEALQTPGPHWVQLLRQNPHLGAQLLQLGRSLLARGDRLGAQRAFEDCANHTGNRAALSALADFWMALDCPEAARSYLSALAGNKLKPGLCLRIARSYAAEQDVENARAWWVRAFGLLSGKQPIPGKPLLGWLTAFRPVYGASVFSELGIPGGDARRLLRLARLYSDGELLLFRRTIRDWQDGKSDGFFARYDFRKILDESAELLSILRPHSSVTDHVLGLLRSRAGTIGTNREENSGVELHFSMSLNIGGTEWHMMRHLGNRPPGERHIVVICQRDKFTVDPRLQALIENTGVEIFSAMEFVENDVKWQQLLGRYAGGATAGVLGKFLDPDLIAACVGALRHFAPRRVTVWGLYIYRNAASAAYLCDVPRVSLRVGSMPLQAPVGAAIGRRSGNLFIAKCCALFMTDRRFDMSMNARAIWRDFQRKTPVAGAGKRVRVEYNPFPRDLVESRPGRTPGELREQLGVPRTHLVLGHVTRIDPNKNLRLWLATAALVAAAVPNVSFLIVGDGQAKDFASRLSRQLGLPDRCHFVGRRVSDLKSYYQLMDALLLTSDCEGLPNSLVEAQALGIPVIARSTGGVVEAVDHGVTGLVVHSRQPQELARAVERVLRDAAFRERARISGPAFIRALTGRPPEPV